MKTLNQSQDDFDAKLNKVVAKIRERAQQQYDYDIRYNVPEKIASITMENAAEHAVKSGLVSGISEWLSWDCDEAMRFAHHILEDSNCHTEAKSLAQFIPEYNK